MSGHSKWAKIKRAKGATDAKRGAVYTKLGNQISLAAKQGGGDPSSNFILRLNIDKAKAENMPKDNIQKAIDRGLGTGKELVVFETAVYEGLYGGDAMFIIDTLTDNKNRTVAEIKKLIESGGGTMGAANSVSWQFDEKGRVNLFLAKVNAPEKYGAASKLVRTNENPEDVMMDIMELTGVDDVVESELEFNDTDEIVKDGDNLYKSLEIYTDKSQLNNIYKSIIEKGYRVESADIVKLPKAMVKLTDEREEKFNNLMSNLDDQDDVQNVWCNVEGF